MFILQRMLVKGHDPTPIYDFVPEEYTRLFDIADRGGLSKPSEFCYTVTALTVQYYSALTGNDHARIRFLTLSNPREAFIFARKKSIAISELLFLATTIFCWALKFYSNYRISI